MIAIDTSKQPFTDTTNSTWVYGTAEQDNDDNARWVKVDSSDSGPAFNITAIYTGEDGTTEHGTLLVKDGETVSGTTGTNIKIKAFKGNIFRYPNDKIGGSYEAPVAGKIVVWYWGGTLSLTADNWIQLDDNRVSAIGGDGVVSVNDETVEFAGSAKTRVCHEKRA